MKKQALKRVAYSAAPIRGGLLFSKIELEKVIRYVHSQSNLLKHNIKENCFTEARRNNRDSKRKDKKDVSWREHYNRSPFSF
jgi:hypothetical protein